jgi:hypothetical protein
MTVSWTSDRGRHCSSTPCSLAVIGGWWSSTCPRRPSSASANAWAVAPGVQLIAADVRTLRVEEPVALWHDRAVFHFLAHTADQRAYAESLRAALAPTGHVIVATFAPEGPETCSGLPVQRYDADELVAVLGFAPRDIVRSEHRVHTTPWGTTQPFTVVVLANGSGAQGAQDVAH